MNSKLKRWLSLLTKGSPKLAQINKTDLFRNAQKFRKQQVANILRSVLLNLIRHFI
jgi:hypothetical protein